MKFAFIKEHPSTLPVVDMCRVLEVSKSGFYRWLGEPVGKRERPPRRARRRDHAGARSQPRRVRQPARVRRAARRGSERLPQHRGQGDEIAGDQGPHTPTLPRTHDRFQARAPDRAQRAGRRFKAQEPNQVWLTDITYIPTDEGWLYLAASWTCAADASSAEHGRAHACGARAGRVEHGPATPPSGPGCWTTPTAACSTRATSTAASSRPAASP